jgi:hypothetical protein
MYHTLEPLIWGPTSTGLEREDKVVVLLARSHVQAAPLECEAVVEERVAGEQQASEDCGTLEAVPMETPEAPHVICQRGTFWTGLRNPWTVLRPSLLVTCVVWEQFLGRA